MAERRAMASELSLSEKGIRGCTGWDMFGGAACWSTPFEVGRVVGDMVGVIGEYEGAGGEVEPSR